jgi:HlyD family secretion protein
MLKKVIFRVVLAAILLGGGWWAYAFFRDLPKSQIQIATTAVRRGDVVVRSFTRGELRAARSATLIAPNLFGTVQVTRLAPLGGFARAKDLIVEFDDSEVNSRLEEQQLALDQIDEQIKKATADLAVSSNQDQVDLLTAQFNVKRAELEVKRNDLLSTIDQKKNELSLEEARQHLKQLESDIQSRQQQAKAQLAVLQENRNKSVLELTREKQRLSQVRLLTPISGLVAIRQNRPNFFFPGMQIPDIREGDQLNPGIPVADVLDLAELEVLARVGELDRANLKEGQDAILQLDAIPGQRLSGKIKSMSGTATANIFSSDPAKKFDVVFSIDMKQLFKVLGVKPEQIQKLMAIAEQNKAHPVQPAMPSMMMMGGPPGGMQAGMQGGGAPGGGGAAGGGGQRVMMGPPGGGQMGGGQMGPGGGQMSQMSPEMMKKVQDVAKSIMGNKKPNELTPDEQKKLMAEIQKVMASANKPSPSTAGRGPAPGSPAPVAGKGGPGAPAPMPPMMGMGGGAQFSAKELTDAKLPPPPEEDSQFDVLLRPGLLADVEIIVDKIPNAISIPTQAVFEKDGKLVAYVKNGNTFEERAFKPLKRSESTMVVESGLKPGETVALSDPTVKKTDKKAGKSEKGGAMGALPGK